MPITLPQSVKKLLQDKAYGHVVTFNGQGDPQLTMVWMDVDGDEVLFNTAEGRKKPQNLRRDPRAALCVLNDGFFGEWIQVEGRAEIVSLPEAMEMLVDYYRSLAGEQGSNFIIVASPAPLPMDQLATRISEDDDGGHATIVTGAELAAFVGDAKPLTDEYAPVDQLLANGG